MEELEQTPNQPMAPLPSIQWFPGHMTKTRRLMEKSLRLVDLVVEIIDADSRIQPQSGDRPAGGEQAPGASA